MTILLLIVFSSLLTAASLSFAAWGFAQLAAGREFRNLGLPGDIAQALHAELEARWRRATLAQEVVPSG